jgi:hypothetical protein
VISRRHAALFAVLAAAACARGEPPRTVCAHAVNGTVVVTLDYGSGSSSCVHATHTTPCALSTHGDVVQVDVGSTQITRDPAGTVCMDAIMPFAPKVCSVAVAPGAYAVSAGDAVVPVVVPGDGAVTCRAFAGGATVRVPHSN